MVSDERTAVMEREASSVQRLSISWDRKADEEKSSRMFSVSVGRSWVNFCTEAASGAESKGKRPKGSGTKQIRLRAAPTGRGI